jgi:hypothetical protein
MVGQDIDFDVSARPCLLSTHDRRVVRAFLRRDREVDAVRDVVAVVEWGIIVIMDVFGEYVLSFLRHVGGHKRLRAFTGIVSRLSLREDQMAWAPKEETRVAIKFWLDCLQVVTVIVGVVTAAVTFLNYSKEQQSQAAEEGRRVAEQNKHAKEQLDAVRRELERPYQERKLSLYLDAARVLAHLASSPHNNKEATEARFWELYWGELAFVESRTEGEKNNGPLSVEHLMVQFCHEYFDPSRCTKGGSPSAGSTKVRSTPTEAAAINMARQASEEIRDRWENIGR